MISETWVINIHSLGDVREDCESEFVCKDIYLYLVTYEAKGVNIPNDMLVVKVSYRLVCSSNLQSFRSAVKCGLTYSAALSHYGFIIQQGDFFSCDILTQTKAQMRGRHRLPRSLH